MHKLISVARPRKAGIAAGAVLAGGLAAGLLLASGTAYAATTNTSTSITGTTQTQTNQGTNLDVHVSVTASGAGFGADWPAGTVTVSDGSASCSVALAQEGGSAGAGSCSLSNLSPGSYTLTATYQGSNVFTGSSGSDSVTIGGGNGNGNGHGHNGYADIATYLSCPSSVYIGETGKCTLYVTNKGGTYAQDVTAEINLPSQLRADNCGYFYGCHISNNTAVENLGSLNRGQTKELSVTFTAKTGLSLWGWHQGHRFEVKVVGSANSNGGFTYYGNQSSSTAYVTIVPTGRWA
jgi:hypothetical protein